MYKFYFPVKHISITHFYLYITQTKGTTCVQQKYIIWKALIYKEQSNEIKKMSPSSCFSFINRRRSFLVGNWNVELLS